MPIRPKSVSSTQTLSRIRYLRKNELKITQEEFAAKIDISRSNLGNIETGKVELTDRVISSICREFNVNKLWILEGKGDIFSFTPEGVVDELAEDFNLDDIDKKIIEKYLELSESQRATIKEYIKSIFE